MSDTTSPAATLLNESNRVFLAWTGMETDLIFNKGLDLPHFAAFPLLENDEGRARIAAYYDELAAAAFAAGHGVIIDTVTWMANADRAAPLGYEADALAWLNGEAVALAKAAKARAAAPAIVSVQVGPRGDAYEAGMTGEAAAETYHAPQIEAAAKAGAELISAYTLGSAEEAIGILRAAQKIGAPAAISFTVETDGKLHDGTPLGDAIERVDGATGGAALAFYVNCAHPDHLGDALDDGAWMARLRGIVANASRQSHAELDEATELDDGDPAEFGAQLAALRKRYPQLAVLGGCCGTDLRHLKAVLSALGEPDV